MLTATSPYPPGPRSRLPAKTLLAFRRDPLGYLTFLAQRHGDAISFMGTGRHFYIFNPPDFIRDVLVTREDCFIKGPALRQAKDMLGEGLLTSESDFHLRQ